MKMKDFFKSFDSFFSIYDNVELRVESETDYSSSYIITDEIFNYNNMWWKDLEITYFCFNFNNVLYITAKKCN